MPIEEYFHPQFRRFLAKSIQIYDWLALAILIFCPISVGFLFYGKVATIFTILGIVTVIGFIPRIIYLFDRDFGHLRISWQRVVKYHLRDTKSMEWNSMARVVIQEGHHIPMIKFIDKKGFSLYFRGVTLRNKEWRRLTDLVLEKAKEYDSISVECYPARF